MERSNEIELWGESIIALQQSVTALQNAFTMHLDSGIPQAQNESPSGTPLSMTIDEMAKELHISRTTAYDLVKQDGFPAFHVGRKILVNRKGLQQWMDNGGTEYEKAC